MYLKWKKRNTSLKQLNSRVMESSGISLARFSIYRKIHMTLITINSVPQQICAIWKILTSFTTCSPSYFIENFYFLPTFHCSQGLKKKALLYGLSQDGFIQQVKSPKYDGDGNFFGPIYFLLIYFKSLCLLFQGVSLIFHFL